MDYESFFKDVLQWIGQVNQMAVQHGMDSELFWNWIADSCGEISKKYNDHRLAIKQMVMLIEWLEEVRNKNA